MRILIACVTILATPAARANISAIDADRGLFARPLTDGIYDVAVPARLTPRSAETLGEVQPNAENGSVVIPARAPFAVRLNGDDAIVSPLIADEAIGATPDVYVFARRDVERLMPNFLATGDAVAMYEKFSQDAVTLIAGRCKWYVERHLGFHVEGMCASAMSGAKLARVGFHPTSCEHAQLKVWGGGRRGCGHVAYKTRSGQWSSTDYVGDPGSKYYAKGCYSRR